MISDQLPETDIFKLILHSSIPFIVWVTWDPGEIHILLKKLSRAIPVKHDKPGLGDSTKYVSVCEFLHTVIVQRCLS
jgi:hypothetical protein